MRLIILNQFFYPDISATSQLMTDLAEDLAGKGVEVTALCSNASYVGQQTLPKSEKHRAVRIERVSTVHFDRKNIVRRLASYLSFYVTAFVRLLRLPRQDVVLVLTTPPLIAAVAYLIHLLRGSKVVYLVQDVYPDIAFAFGMMRRESLAGRFFDALSRFLLRKADVVIALGSCMRERLVAKGVPPEKIAVIPNWADGTQIQPASQEGNRFRAEHGLEGKFVVLYSGNMGRAHDFTPIFKAMMGLAEERQIAFVFIGGGARRPELEEFLKQHPEVNARVLDYVPREQLGMSMAAADLSLVAVADGLEGLVVPSKLYGIMASGRPALYLGPAASEAARTIERIGCGYVVTNQDEGGSVTAILHAYRDRAAAEEMGKRARWTFEQEFDRPVAMAKYLQLLQRITKV